MKICLVMAFLEEGKWKNETLMRDNLGIAYLASMLRKNDYHVDIYNAEMKMHNDKIVGKYLLENNYDFIGFSCSSQRNFIPTMDIINLIRRKGYRNHISIGGVFASTAAEEILNFSPNIDSVMIGDGEFTILELIQAIENDSSIKSIKGVCYRTKDNLIIKNENREKMENLDSLPFPAQDDMEYYRKDLENGIFHYRILAGRGCYGNCTFCSVLENKHKRILRTPKNLIDEISFAVETYNCYWFRFSDDIFYDCSSKTLMWLDEFINMLKKQDYQIKFDVMLRATDIKKELIDRLVDVGLRRVFLGIESGSDDVLKRFNKMCTVKQNEMALDILNQYSKLEVVMGYIMFEPEMTFFDLKKSFYWLKKYKYNATKHNLYNKLNVYYNTIVYHRLKSIGLLEETDFWERNSYAFKDQQVAAVLKCLEEKKAELMNVHNIFNELLNIEFDLKRQRNLLKAKELRAALDDFSFKEKEYWFEYFEKILINIEKGVSVFSNDKIAVSWDKELMQLKQLYV